jgi:glycosyltransferase involved in cell wall biosynthesis
LKVAGLTVCVATTVFPRWLGDGEGTFIWQLVRMLRQQEIAVRVVAMHSPGLPHREQWDGVPIVRPPYWWPAGAEMLRKDGGGLPVNFRRYPRARVQLPTLILAHARAIAREARGSALVHAHFTLSAAAARLAQPMHRLPVVATVHGSDLFQVPKLPLGRAFTRQTLQAAAAITAVSQALRGACVEVGVPAERVQVISNSIDTAAYAPPAPVDWATRAPAILYVGSLIPRKGVDTLVAAMPALLAALPGVRLAIIGDGPEEAALRRQAEALSLAGQVDFLGFQPQAVVRAWMQRARLFVLPSREEGQGVVLLEALASGTPVVASRVGGIPEVLGNGTGILVEAGNAPALAGAMIELLSSPSQWEALSAAGLRHVQRHYSMQVIGERYQALYASVLARRAIGERV